ncbi:MAG TPA: hypothetical protein VM324_11090 [Egibacteraceae bacterium]|nr:hypothetical protein [Egibacteraceae bacterium]
MRRPTVAAWSLNQLARREPDGLAALRAVGGELALAQRRALSGCDHTGCGGRRQGRAETAARRADGADEALADRERALADAEARAAAARATRIAVAARG